MPENETPNAKRCMHQKWGFPLPVKYVSLKFISGYHLSRD